MNRAASMTEPQAAAGAGAGAGAGALLRAARERQGLHVAALAAAIKIPQRKLEALEAGRFEELPDATFTRALAIEYRGKGVLVNAVCPGYTDTEMVSGAVTRIVAKTGIDTDTAVATIGIRGTEYAVAYGRSITVTTNSGLVEVCNNAGCLLVEAGQSAYVPDANTAPAFTQGSALDPLKLPTGPSMPEFSAGDSPGKIAPPPQRLPSNW